MQNECEISACQNPEHHSLRHTWVYCKSGGEGAGGSYCFRQAPISPYSACPARIIPSAAKTVVDIRQGGLKASLHFPCLCAAPAPRNRTRIVIEASFLCAAVPLLGLATPPPPCSPLTARHARPCGPGRPLRLAGRPAAAHRCTSYAAGAAAPVGWVQSIQSTCALICACCHPSSLTQRPSPPACPIPTCQRSAASGSACWRAPARPGNRWRRLWSLMSMRSGLRGQPRRPAHPSRPSAGAAASRGCRAGPCSSKSCFRADV